ncbi:alpha-galactosidase [Nonomuraea solani]|uniref:Alpha-galactosidase n=1 Tax=Nonomuraea solani TaxID=1144553 RepID=A0A1H5Y0I4_9ACTN|nr:NPCBM/NEW2 domain-containing protein [Nonomuraea solani]SEG17448.1 alpha-galactosidase [Nonomuraea solani]
MRGFLSLILLAALLPLGAATPSWAARAEAAVAKLPLTPTPPMGWSSWNKFRCNITEDLIKQSADALISSGMKDAGYTYVNIDDCWMAPQRDANGDLQADPVRFPGGIRALADYVHARGLKLGIYSSAGTKTCQGLPASLGHEEADAGKFAEWEVDLLKYDNCNDGGVPAIERFTTMAEALAATGRPIVYSICEWGANKPWEWAGALGHYWRTTGDIADRWGSMVAIVDQQAGLERFSGPNAWNDPDMLEVGNGGMTEVEYRSHISLWALLNAPLIAGNDLRTMSAATKEMLTNPEVIAIDQDWAGVQGHKISDRGDLEVWAKPLSRGGAAVVLFNRGPVGAEVATTATDLGLKSWTGYRMRDVWTNADTHTRDQVRASVPAHGSRMFVVKPGPPGKVPPAVAADVRTDTEGFVEAGQTFTATVRFSVDGLPPVRDAEVTPAVPEGWSVKATGPTRARVVVPGRPFSARFEVTVPGGAGKGIYGLTSQVTTRGGRQVTGYGSVAIAQAPQGDQWLSDLDALTADVGYGTMGRDTNVGGKPIKIAGVPYPKGLAPHAASEVRYFLDRRCTRFTVAAGIDDGTNRRGSVTFQVLGDDRSELAATGVIRGGEPAVPLDVDVTNVLVLTLVTGIGPDNNNSDHSIWGSPRIVCAV